MSVRKMFNIQFQYSIQNIPFMYYIIIKISSHVLNVLRDIIILIVYIVITKFSLQKTDIDEIFFNPTLFLISLFNNNLFGDYCNVSHTI